MAETKRVGDLDIDQDLDHQARAWRAQRVGWAAMALVLAAGALGLFGPGLLNRATAGQDGSLQVEYPRFWRSNSSMTLRAHLPPDAVDGAEARLWLSRSYLDGLRIQAVTPEPERVEAGPDRLTYVFVLTEPGAPMAATFHVEAQRFGPFRARVGAGTGQAVQFMQFIYP